MKTLDQLLRRGRTLRVMGFDDAPFEDRPAAPVAVAGVVCAGTRFEGMVWGQVERDGLGATEVLVRLLEGSKFQPQVHLVLLDGLAVGGFNLVDLPEMAGRLGRPCVAVMRRAPDLSRIRRALRSLPRAAARLRLLERAGTIHHQGPFWFQVQGASPEATAEALARLTREGHVPEALRLAHLIGGAVVSGESGRRA